MAQNQHPNSSKQPKEVRNIYNKLRVILNRLARYIADLVSKNGYFQPVLGTIILKFQDDGQCVNQVSSMWALLLPK